MSPAAAITTEALRLVSEGLDDILAFALACTRRPADPASRALALLTFTAARRRKDAP